MAARNRPAPVAAAAAAAALAAALALASCGSGRGTGHQAEPSTAAPTTSAPTTTTATPPGRAVPAVTGPYDWTRAASPALAIGGGASSTLAAIVPPAGSSPWTVAGSRLGADGGSTATVWTSSDGRTWGATSLTGPQVDSSASAAASWRQGTVVVGSVGRGPDSRAAVWVSAGPGAPYVQVPTAELSAGAPAGDTSTSSGSTMTAVAAGAVGLVASGTANGRVALWYSTNGQRWTELASAERVINGADDPHVQTLLAGLEGNVYAAGWQRIGASITAAMWTSSDGINWRPVLTARTAFAGPGDRLITGLATFGTGLVAVGGIRTGPHWSAASWISPNGASWSDPSVSFGLGPRPQPDAAEGIVLGLSAVATGVHSAALTAVGGGPTAQRLWTSTDGLHWREVNLPTAAVDSAGWHASLVAIGGTTTVIADADPGQPHLLVHRPIGWLEPSSDPAVFGAVQAVARPAGLATAPTGLLLAVEIDQTPQTVGPNRSSVEFLSSADGTTWVPLETAATFARSDLAALVATSRGFLAAGWTQVGAGRRAAVWISPDGGSWSAGRPLDAGTGAASDEASGVCVAAPVVAVVGGVDQAGGFTARAWVSGDDQHWTVATIGPQAVPGVSSAMSGCVAEPTGGPGAERIDVFGTTSSKGSGPSPAYWSAEGSTAWSRDPTSPFGTSLPFPVVDVARTGALVLATTGGPDVDDLPSGLQSTAGGTSGLWRFAGSAGWQRLDTPSPPWVGAEPAQFRRAAWFGLTPVVAGVVDGRLAVWTGTFDG